MTAPTVAMATVGCRLNQVDSQDLAARLENDEFAILLYGCSPDDAQRVGRRLVAEVAELGRAYPEALVTASQVGAAQPDRTVAAWGRSRPAPRPRRALEEGGRK